MAPEQIRAFGSSDDLAKLDARADLFSLGVLLYELLTGRHPFGPVPVATAPKELAALLLERQRSGFVPLHRLNPDVSPLEALPIERCLAFDPVDRPASAAALAEELRRYFTPPARCRRWALRHVGAVAGMAGALLLTLAAIAWGLAVRDPAAVRASRQAAEALAQNDHAGAIVYLSRAIEADHNRASAWFDRGQARLRCAESPADEATAQVEAALADFKVARQLAEETAGPACEALHRRGRLPEGRLRVGGAMLHGRDRDGGHVGSGLVRPRPVPGEASPEEGGPRCRGEME
jgi:hypothetical protein